MCKGVARVLVFVLELRGTPLERYGRLVREEVVRDVERARELVHGVVDRVLELALVALEARADVGERGVVGRARERGLEARLEARLGLRLRRWDVS